MPWCFWRDVSELLYPLGRHHPILHKATHPYRKKQHRVEGEAIGKRQANKLCGTTKTDVSPCTNSTKLEEGESSTGKLVDSIPGLIKLVGSMTMHKAETQRTTAPINSSRNPNHSFAPLVWKSIVRLPLTLLMFASANLCSFLKHLIVVTPRIVSEKWWMTGALVIDSRRVSSRDVER